MSTAPLSRLAFVVSGLIFCVQPALAQTIDCNHLVAPFAIGISKLDHVIPKLDRDDIIGPGEAIINRDAQKTHSVSKLRAAYSLSGYGVTVGVWDLGAVLKTHREFGARVTLGDKPAIYSRHSTHVAGTIGARGVSRQAQGMAPKVSLVSYDWKDKGTEICQAARGKADGTKVSVSNHSYSLEVGWEFVEKEECRWRWWFGDLSTGEDDFFGKYDKTSSGQFDAIVFAHQFHSVFVASGNDRGDVPEEDTRWDGKYCTREGVRQWKKNEPGHPPSDRDRKNGYYTISGYGLAKNVITIGAVNDIVKEKHMRTRADIVSTDFTSWGPANGGRIKPDVVANGFELESPALAEGRTVDINLANLKRDAYRKLDGTSMATPVAAGIGALLNELAVRTMKRLLRADEMRAALIHTAWSGTGDDSPTYALGWGLIQADEAGDLIARKKGRLIPLSKSVTPLKLKLSSRGTDAIRVTLTWLDPPASAAKAALDIYDGVLVRDLDLKLTSPSGVEHFPWSLDPSAVQKGANNKAKNSVDNSERVDVPASKAEKGMWTISVVHSNGSESVPFALAVAGLN